MEKCYISKMKITGSLLKEESPYPFMAVPYESRVHAEAEDAVKKELRLNYGLITSTLPYTLQDEYDRETVPLTLRTAVLENENLKAVFLPDYGARLWSLYSKKDGRELLHCNRVFLPSNLAVRNAWFAGGVEWNMGFRGHSPFTYDKVFCEICHDSGMNVPVLKFYEWERKRKTKFELYAYLPPQGEDLVIKVKLSNYAGQEVPMYWWSNIAVPETVDTRVIVPSTCAYTNDYSGCVHKVPVPYYDRKDLTYTTGELNSRDYFFRIPPEEPKFIATADKYGKGLLQQSTKRLMSRKLFLWGMRRCYRNWQNLLSEICDPYIEIQAGLAQTQMECIPMPKDAVWEWTEAYGSFRGDPHRLHSQNWEEAVACAKEQLGTVIEREELRVLQLTDGETVLPASGWGALENVLRKRNGLPVIPDFPPSSIGRKEQIWLDLLEGSFPCPKDYREAPVSFTEEEELLNRLTEQKENWYAQYLLGAGRWAQGKKKEAEECFTRSAALYENPLNLYGLSFCKAERKDPAAVSLIVKALDMAKNDYHLLREAFQMLIDFGEYRLLIQKYEELPEERKAAGRMKLFLLYAYIKLKRIEDCDRLLRQPFVIDDLREGENVFVPLWFEYCKLKGEELEVPAWLDYLYRQKKED